MPTIETSGSQTAISVRDLSKCYRMYDKPQDRLKQAICLGRKRFYREFWALHNVSFDIARGKTVGIVGRNGSGKSTLLQIICGTLAASGGEMHVEGRVAALLELGAGFNPEFTGRDNIFMNAAILGMSRQEIAARYDDIVAFSELKEFIDRPVKTYSSGMFVRLAFAVAISVEPEILVVDEALAVGDEAFQRKCYSQIQRIKQRGGTILFVSHSAMTVVDLCNEAILLDAGEVLMRGTPKSVVAQYHKLLYTPGGKVDAVRSEIKRGKSLSVTDCIDTGAPRHAQTVPARAKGDDDSAYYDPNLQPKSTVVYESQGLRISKPRILSNTGQQVNVLCRRGEYVYTFEVDFDKPACSVRFGMLIKTITGAELGGATSATMDEAIEWIDAGTRAKVEFRFRCNLLPGVYFLNAGALGRTEDHEVFLDRHVDASMFRVQPEEDMVGTVIVDFLIEPRVVLEEPGKTKKAA